MLRCLILDHPCREDIALAGSPIIHSMPYLYYLRSVASSENRALFQLHTTIMYIWLGWRYTAGVKGLARYVYWDKGIGSKDWGLRVLWVLTDHFTADYPVCGCNLQTSSCQFTLLPLSPPALIPAPL